MTAIPSHNSPRNQVNASDMVAIVIFGVPLSIASKYCKNDPLISDSTSLGVARALASSGAIFVFYVKIQTATYSKYNYCKADFYNHLESVLFHFFLHFNSVVDLFEIIRILLL